MPDTDIQRAQDVRDLRNQIGTLQVEEQQEIVFKEISPRRVKRTIYSMTSGEPLTMPRYMAERAISKRLDNGGYMFTARKEEAPEYKLGEIKCFLHRESPDQVFLQEIGLSGIYCPKATIANPHSKRMHALHRHHDEWEAYQDFLNDRKETATNKRQQDQIDATLALAEKASGTSLPKVRCNACGQEIEGKLSDHQCQGGVQG